MQESNIQRELVRKYFTKALIFMFSYNVFCKQHSRLITQTLRKLSEITISQRSPTSGVSAGHIMPHWVLWSCRGRASLPSRPTGELRRRRCDRVEANVRRFNTCREQHKSIKSNIQECSVPVRSDTLIQDYFFCFWWNANIWLFKVICFTYFALTHLPVEPQLTCDTPALVWLGFFWSPQLPVAREYLRPSVMMRVLMASSRLKSLPRSMNFCE